MNKLQTKSLHFSLVIPSSSFTLLYIHSFLPALFIGFASVLNNDHLIVEQNLTLA